MELDHFEKGDPVRVTYTNDTTDRESECVGMITDPDPDGFEGVVGVRATDEKDFCVLVNGAFGIRGYDVNFDWLGSEADIEKR